jgi:hypothetical protein
VKDETRRKGTEKLERLKPTSAKFLQSFTAAAAAAATVATTVTSSATATSATAKTPAKTAATVFSAGLWQDVAPVSHTFTPLLLNVAPSCHQLLDQSTEKNRLPVEPNG